MKKEVGTKKYISLAKAAKIYGCTPEHLNLMSRQGKLRAVKLERNWFTTKKWLREYKKFVKKSERRSRQKTHLVSNVRAIHPSQIKNLFKRIFVFVLASIVLIVLISATFVGAKQGLFEDIFDSVTSAYSETFKSTKDSIESLVFSYAGFIEDSFHKISTPIKSIKYRDININKFSKTEKPFFAFELENLSVELLKSDFPRKSDFSHLAEVRLPKKVEPLVFEKSNFSYKDSIVAFFVNSLSDSVENIGRDMGNSFIKVDLNIFDFSEELGEFSENIDKSLALVGSFHKKIVETKDRKK